MPKRVASEFSLRPRRPVESAMAMAVAVKVDETDHGRFVERDSLPCSDFVQRVVDMRQMVRSDVTDEGSHDFVIAHAAMHPGKKQDELRADGNCSGKNAVPM